MKRGIDITVKNLNLTLNNSEILRDITMHVKSGSIHCLIGPNGGGKTTLLRCILGQMQFKGEIKIDYDENVCPKGPVIGYVPQILDFERNLPITVEDFMAMTYQMRPCFAGITAHYKAEMERLLDELGVLSKRKNLLGKLSGGERQRVLLAQALYPAPNLLVLDEPLTGIDQIGEEYFKKMLFKLKDEGVTILWIHHNIKQVIEMADTVSCIKQTVTLDGAPKEVITEEQILSIFS